ncbi:ExbD/TolR family protein [Gemmata sp.]|uniref:ExbD/TolR family protein n=1 Tax=Gemmata sp. TaxID=1914242 RepID=UPI003F703B27
MSSRRSVTELVEPDLPITPMLDMSFQLLAFFILTFRPSPTEGQIALRLPPLESMTGQEIKEPLDVEDDKPARFVVQVTASDKGTIEKITLRSELGADDKNLGADPAALLKELKGLVAAETKRREAAAARGTKIPPPKLTIEIGNKLLQAPVVQVFDAAVQAGFTDVSTTPLDRERR